MRITGGRFGGFNISVPRTNALRPTQDRVREALFSMLQTEIAGADFLDLFAGSGAVGLEALSRGARHVTFVDSDVRHLRTLQANLALLARAPDTDGLRNAAQTVRADAYRWLATYAGAGFTIGFADPPYALGEERGYTETLRTLARRGVIRPGGLFIAEMTAAQRVEAVIGWDLLRERTYGKSRLDIWRRLDATPAPDAVSDPPQENADP